MTHEPDDAAAAHGHPHPFTDLPVDPDVDPISPPDEEPGAGATPAPVLPIADLLRRDLSLLPLIALGGALGALARWGLAEALPAEHVHWGTVAANIAGCFLLAVLMELLLERAPHSRFRRPFFGVGVLGGFTTFSTAMLELHDFLADGRFPLAVATLTLHVAGGTAAVVLGLVTTRWAVTGRRRLVEEPAQ
ncbi:CrcB family protein [Nocardioides sp. GY 10113]|uniref:fluoride efflux transporter FluC n=1 Tax=Nocardioides sp. GY 10113 TaxID=2569761 RepID=UPI0010A82978|nr:CrcB family protein [Nocardioides sp. GY 10113]TIC88345.1 CrcB family protein [Nocardioides sp. GY 10113]